MTTRRERLERKLEKRLKWAESRREKSSSAWDRSDLSNAMRQVHEHHKMSKHHEQKANGIKRQLATTIYSDDDDAIEALEAKVARLEAGRKQNNAVNKIIRRKPKNEKTPEKITELVALGLTEATAGKLFEPDFCGRIGIPSYVNQNLGGRIKAARDRIVSIKRQNEKRERVEASEECREYGKK